MDIVKNIPILIKGFEYYLSNNQKDNKSILLIIAPHHRRNSKLYDKEHKKIINILKSSKFKNKIFLFTENLSIQELKILYKFANIFFSTSLYD
jgi:trehalose-6-phosphate synthase